MMQIARILLILGITFIVLGGIAYLAARVNLPLGRPGEPSEVGELAVWLCSPLASYVNGQTISVDGGASVA